jgi:hypothetical protein
MYGCSRRLLQKALCQEFELEESILGGRIGEAPLLTLRPIGEWGRFLKWVVDYHSSRDESDESRPLNWLRLR